jgi:hypothetical protein
MYWRIAYANIDKKWRMLYATTMSISLINIIKSFCPLTYVLKNAPHKFDPN